MQKIKNRTEKRCDFFIGFLRGGREGAFFWDYPLAISVRICYIIYNCFVIWERCAENARTHIYKAAAAHVRSPQANEMRKMEVSQQ